jgi:hypothetical protein
VNRSLASIFLRRVSFPIIKVQPLPFKGLASPLPCTYMAQRPSSSGPSPTRSESPEAGISVPASPSYPVSLTSSHSTTHRCLQQAAHSDHVLATHASPLKKSPFKNRPRWAFRRGDSADTIAVVSTAATAIYSADVGGESSDGRASDESRSLSISESLRGFEITRVQIQEDEKPPARDARRASLRKRKSLQM